MIGVLNQVATVLGWALMGCAVIVFGFVVHVTRRDRAERRRFEQLNRRTDAIANGRGPTHIQVHARHPSRPRGVRP